MAAQKANTLPLAEYTTDGLRIIATAHDPGGKTRTGNGEPTLALRGHHDCWNDENRAERSHSPISCTFLLRLQVQDIPVSRN